jgi:hypothetical protein
MQALTRCLETEIGYLAGLTDGEGCFTVALQCYKKTARRYANLLFHPKIEIKITGNDDWVKRVKDILSRLRIKCCSIPFRRNNPRWKDGFMVVIQHRYALMFAKILLPYLTVKRQVAEAFLKRPKGNRMDRHRRLNWHMIEKWIAYIETLRKLNTHHNTVKWTRKRILNYYRAIANET